MKKILFSIPFILPFLGTSQVVLNQIDDFEDYTTRNWTKSSSVLPNENILTGGPKGVNDKFLRVRSAAGGQLTTFNNAQWIGDYYRNNGANKITYISMDVRNSGSNIIFLRLAFINTAWSNDPKWSSTNAVAVVPGQGWKRINFPISENSLTRLNHTNAYGSDFDDIAEVRLIHNDAPAWDSDPIEAILDIDNIMARNSPALGIDQVESNKSVNLFPNPANNFISLQNTANLKNESFEYEIFDSAGKLAKKGNSKFNEKINIDSLTTGSYIIQIIGENGEKLIKKLMKN